jgi:sigma-B regulation protein RsbU (phosphoserine phosphatase)
MAFLLDVSGHGISSAMVTVSVNQSLSTHTSQIVKKVFSEPPYYRLLSPAEVMCELANEYPFDRFDKFFTIVYLLINIKSGKLSYSCAGHPAPLLLRADGSTEWLTTGGGLIGLLDTGPYEEGHIDFQPGDRLFLYSDGLIEYCDYSGEAFGTERLVDVLGRDGEDLKTTCRSVRKALDHFGNHRALQDDVSLLGVEFLGRG